LGATLNAALVVVGDRLGLYKAMKTAGPMDAAAPTGASGGYRQDDSWRVLRQRADLKPSPLPEGEQ
jgi:hypothetical protein